MKKLDAGCVTLTALGLARAVAVDAPVAIAIAAILLGVALTTLRGPRG